MTVSDMAFDSYWHDSWQLLIWQSTVTDRTNDSFRHDSFRHDSWQFQTWQLTVTVWQWADDRRHLVTYPNVRLTFCLFLIDIFIFIIDSIRIKFVIFTLILQGSSISSIIQSTHRYTSGAHIQHRQMTNGLDDNSNELNWSHRARHSKNGPKCWLVIVILHKPKPGVWT